MSGARAASSGQRRLFVLLIWLATSACAGKHPFVAPADLGTPAPEAADAWEDATSVCRTVKTYRASLSVTGTVGEQRIRGLAGARLLVALTAAGDIGFEAYVSGQPLFRLGGRSDAATLLQRDGNRVTTAPPDEILDALIAVKLTPAELLSVLTGCGTTRTSFESTKLNRDGIVQLSTGDARIFLELRDGHWHTRAVFLKQLAVDYWIFEKGLPREMTLRSLQGQTTRATVSLRVQESAINAEIAPSALTVTVPEGAVSTTLDELRSSGPLGRGSSAP